MSDKQPIKGVKGVKDTLPEQSPQWRWVEDVAQEIFSLYNFREIRTPIFEKTAVFSKSIGETSDIVEKEMYTFKDRGDESLTLRPEGTASVVRSYVEHKLYNPPGVVKLFYMGPMFRAERPQAGRFRQFHQIGAEVFGTDDPSVDAEVIIMLMDYFTALGVKDLTIKLNSLGCAQCRPGYRKKLGEFLNKKIEKLCENCTSRVDRNPLRALDCKSPSCKEVVKEAPTITSCLCEDCKIHFNAVRAPLLDLELPVVIDHMLVRGLDYYTRTAFEVTCERLGAQNSVAGGGRYDSLVEQFGGPQTPAIGFALGMERLISLIDKEEVSEFPPDVFIVPMTEEAANRVHEIAHRLRSEGICVERAFGVGGMKKMMKQADRSCAPIAIIIGEDELANETCTLKEMKTGVQKEIPFSSLAETLFEMLDSFEIDE